MSFLSRTWELSKFLTSPAIRHSRRSGSNSVIGPTPDRPATIAAQVLATSRPRAVSIPIPVTTTRRGSAGQSGFGRRALMRCPRSARMVHRKAKPSTRASAFGRARASARRRQRSEAPSWRAGRSSDELARADGRGPVDVARQATGRDRVGDGHRVEFRAPDLGGDLGPGDIDEGP